MPPLRSLLPFVTVLVLVAPVVSGADQADCNGDKLRSLSKSSSSLLACRAKTVRRSEPPDPACASEAGTSLADGFTKAEADPECASTGEAASVASALQDFDADLLAMLVVSPDGARCASAKVHATRKRAKSGIACLRKAARAGALCAAAKVLATSKRASLELACRREAALDGLAADPLCIESAQERLAKKFTKLEARGQCDTTGDAAAVGARVTAFLTHAAAHIDGSAPGPHPTDLTATVVGSAIELAWIAPDPASGLGDARVLRLLNADPSGPDDPLATVVYEGPGTTAADDLTALLPDTSGTARTYHYAVYGCDPFGNCETTGSLATVSPTVVQALRAGGYVVHWRHASADVCSDRTDLGTAATTSVPDWWKSCDADCGTATARQLNANGVAESIAIGDAFDTLGITVGRVLTSEFCRNVETAALMDFGPVLEEVQELTFFVYDEASRCSDSFALLGMPPAAGTNTALIGHSGNSCPPLSQLAWAEAAIYKPDGTGGTTFIDRVLDDEWLTLP